MMRNIHASLFSLFLRYEQLRKRTVQLYGTVRSYGYCTWVDDRYENGGGEAPWLGARGSGATWARRWQCVGSNRPACICQPSGAAKRLLRAFVLSRTLQDIS